MQVIDTTYIHHMDEKMSKQESNMNQCKEIVNLLCSPRALKLSKLSYNAAVL